MFSGQILRSYDTKWTWPGQPFGPHSPQRTAEAEIARWVGRSCEGRSRPQSVTRCHIDELPEEMLLAIFDWVDPGTLFFVVPKVCLRWQLICKTLPVSLTSPKTALPRTVCVSSGLRCSWCDARTRVGVLWSGRRPTSPGMVQDPQACHASRLLKGTTGCSGLEVAAHPTRRRQAGGAGYSVCGESKDLLQPGGGCAVVGNAGWWLLLIITVFRWLGVNACGPFGNYRGVCKRVRLPAVGPPPAHRFDDMLRGACRQ